MTSSLPLDGGRTSFKMAASGKEGIFCVLRFHMGRLVSSVQRQIRTRFRQKPSAKNSIQKWYDKFQRAGCLCKSKSSGRPSTSEASVERIREYFQSLFLVSFLNHIWSFSYICRVNST